MSARRRVALIVGAVALAAVAVVAAAVLSSDGGSAASETTTTPGLRPGRPPLSLAFGFRTDDEAWVGARDDAYVLRARSVHTAQRRPA